MVTVADVRTVALCLPRTEEALVRDQVKFRVGRIVYAGPPTDEARLKRLRPALVLEGQLDLRAIDELAAVPDVNVLLDDLGDPNVPDRLARRIDRLSGSLLPGGGACADDVDHPVDAHCCPPRWMCRSTRFGTVMISHLRAEGNHRRRSDSDLPLALRMWTRRRVPRPSRRTGSRTGPCWSRPSLARCCWCGSGAATAAHRLRRNSPGSSQSSSSS